MIRGSIGFNCLSKYFILNYGVCYTKDIYVLELNLWDINSVQKSSIQKK